MNNTLSRIQNVTSRGQITLPSVWRNKFASKQISLVVKGNKLEIKPVNIFSEKGEYTVFDAIRDNDGEGIKAEGLSKILKELNE